MPCRQTFLALRGLSGEPRPCRTPNFCASKMIFSFFGIKKAAIAGRSLGLPRGSAAIPAKGATIGIGTSQSWLRSRASLLRPSGQLGAGSEQRGFTTKQAIQDSGCKSQFDKIEKRDLQDASSILRRLSFYRTTHPERTFDNKRIWFAEDVTPRTSANGVQQPGGTGFSGYEDDPLASDSPAKVADAEDLPQASPSLFEKEEESIRRGGPAPQLLGNGVRRVEHGIQPLNLDCRF